MSGQSPPGPGAWPLVGGLLQLGRDPLAAVTELNRIYGGFVALGRVGRRQLYLVSDPEASKHILQGNAQNYLKGASSRRMKPVFGQGSLLLEGTVWRQRRKLVQPAFHRDKIGSVADAFVDAAVEVAERWTAAGGAVVDLRDEMLRMTMALTVRNFFRTEITAEIEELLEAWYVLYADLSRNRLSLVSVPRAVPTPANRRYREAFRTFDRILKRMVEERRAADDGSVLSMLIRARDEDDGTTMDDEQLRDEMIVLFVGGYETSSNALAFALAMLSTHPAAAERLRAEVDAVLGTRRARFEDLAALPYTRWFLQETMRLYPPSWTVTRENVEDDVVLGYPVAAGSQFFVSQYATHHDARIWPNPEGFDPTRFDEARSAGRPRFAYFPFGGGPRVCLGDRYALTEMHLVLATLAHRCRVELLAGTQVAPSAMVGLRPRYPLRATVGPR